MIKNLIKKLLPSFLISWYHFKLAFLAAILYRFPSRSLKVIGVTGTNGKSTTVYFMNQILREAGFKTAALSSIEFQINDKRKQNTLRMTMPGRFFVQKFLRQAADQGCQYVILEVTSEGIKQHRHKFINFEAAVFTNLTPEHIESHGGFENYKKAKGKLFAACRNIHIVNSDDENAEYFFSFKAKEKYFYQFKNQNAKIKITNQNSKIIEIPRLELKLAGDFNVYNALAAICVGLSQGVSLDVCRRAVEKVEGIPGRMEEVVLTPFKVVVDYAFTSNALRKVYETLLKSKIKNQNQSTQRVECSAEHSNQKFECSESKLICALGAAGGGRDKWKRPVLGGIAAKYCDEIIITNEDPYDENPLEIMDQIESGFSKIQSSKSPASTSRGEAGKIQKIIDRREAIREALKSAKPGDTVVITGKGCEPSICLANGKRIPWDDRQVVREEFKKLTAPTKSDNI